MVLRDIQVLRRTGSADVCIWNVHLSVHVLADDAAASSNTCFLGT